MSTRGAPSAPSGAQRSTSNSKEPAKAGSAAPNVAEALGAQPFALDGSPEPDGAFERSAAHSTFDPFGPLDSDDIELLQQQEAKRMQRERRRCLHCGTVFHPVSPSVDECPSLERHEARCRGASPAERAFYAAHRRWPRAGQVEAAGEEAA